LTDSNNSDSEEIPPHLGNPKIYCRVHKNK